MDLKKFIPYGKFEAPGKCYNCAGSGLVPCGRCGGCGRSNGDTCPDCGGRGTTLCGRCDGSGIIDD
ncbi:MAG: hypothetical protein J6L88_04585 [Clostridia bacterium]|nr:hypothetical protein [Clostridia bacterium]